ncbi:hypothetical protein CEP52_009052 [Fusarium oligoseptatum]|uniref:non-specific serine/threonine protein kinase n=1 Tax=Fusarium oligoseptatum TaxID=2604345 RepID=A0A428TEY5_9HYPO|nr:hypothetical protein CEP52_009052 [Fusarium oligoseptatum]
MVSPPPPPLPSHGSYGIQKTKGLDRLKEMRNKDRTQALYGDSPPPPRQPAPDWDRITMEYVEGETLQQAWPGLTDDQRSGVLAQLREYISQMRALGGIYLGRLDGQGVLVPSIMTRSGGPFATVSEFHDWLVKPPKRLKAQSMYWHQITTQLAVESPIVFTHGDIAARNILVCDGLIVALLDWEYAGWYPEY